MSIRVPYHRADISEADIERVVEVLRSGWLTSGPRSSRFETAFAQYKGVSGAVAVNSCTAALRLCLHVLDLKPGEEVITTPITFVATANSILHAGGKPVFVDVEPGTMNIGPENIAKSITPRTRAILVVHVGGNPCDMDGIMALARLHNLEVIEDCAHAIEGSFAGRSLGTWGHSSAFSFYATKNITTAEGGMVLASEPEVLMRIKRLSLHGLDKGTYQRMEQDGSPLYDVLEPGFKMNMSDVQAALGLSQLQRIRDMYNRRLVIKQAYDQAFQGMEAVNLIKVHSKGTSALHLYQLILNPSLLSISRDEFVQAARARGVELSVNYLPIHLFTWYRDQLGYKLGDFPDAEFVGKQNISLPFFPSLTDAETAHVQHVITEILNLYRR